MTRGLLAGLLALGLAAVPATAAAQNGGAASRARQRQEQITTMERVLENAVQNGVNRLRDRLRAIMPADVLIQDTRPEVRGFPLEGFGVFFDVEVPALRQSVAWTLQQMTRSSTLLARDLQQLRQFIETMPDPAARAQFDRIVQNIQRQVGPVGPIVVERQANGQGQPALAAGNLAGGVNAQSLPPNAAGPVAADPQLMLDPDEAYTEEVKNALVNAMINYGVTLSIGPDEWLSVAARDNAPVNPLVQSDSDFRTIMFRLKGSDLIEFQTQRLTLEQVRERVSIQEF